MTACRSPIFRTDCATRSGSSGSFQVGLAGFTWQKPQRRERVVPGGLARLHVAEAAAARAGVAEDHEGGGSALPAVADVGTGGLAADGVQVVVADELVELAVAVPAGELHLEPGGLALTERQDVAERFGCTPTARIGARAGHVLATEIAVHSHDSRLAWGLRIDSASAGDSRQRFRLSRAAAAFDSDQWVVAAAAGQGVGELLGRALDAERVADVERIGAVARGLLGAPVQRQLRGGDPDASCAEPS